MRSWLMLLFPLVLIALAVLFLGVPSVTCGLDGPAPAPQPAPAWQI